MSDLTEFLLARIAEDEATTQACVRDVGTHRTGEQYADGSGEAEQDAFPSYPWGSWEPELSYMAGPGHPDRALAEVRAKRRIVEVCSSELEEGSYSGEWVQQEVLLALAQPYAEHPDYRQEWKP